MGPCIFCEIVRGTSPASVVYEDSAVMAFMDINPVQKGHTLVIPKAHIVDIWDIDPEVLVKVVFVAGRVAQRMKDVLGSEGINTFTASGKPAGQDIFHFHLHVIPLAKGERTKFAAWWLSVINRAERSELDGLASKLRLGRIPGS